MPILSGANPASANAILAAWGIGYGELTCPQHPNAATACTRCGKHDGRTKFGAIHCHDCKDELEMPS